MLVCCGAGTEAWFGQVAGYQEERGIWLTSVTATAVLLAPPLTERKRPVNEYVVINGDTDLTAGLFEPFFSRFR